MPNDRKRHRAGRRISAGFVESVVNEMVAKRVNEPERASRHPVQSFLEVRIRVLNLTLDNAFRPWHLGFRTIANRFQLAVSA
jgi:hypothetical protein